MGRIYYAVLDALSVSSLTDLYWIGSPTDAITVIHEVKVSQEVSETSEQLPLMVFRTATDNSGQGSALTPSPTETGYAAYGGTVRTNVFSISAETTDIWRDAQNVLNGWHWLPTPEERVVLSPTAGTAGRLAVRLDVVPAVALTVSGYVVLEEIGG